MFTRALRLYQEQNKDRVVMSCQSLQIYKEQENDLIVVP